MRYQRARTTLAVPWILLADDLHQHALAPPAIELAVEDLFPRAESSLPLVMATTTSRPMTCRFRCASALSSPVRLCWYWEVGACGRQLLQPHLVIVEQAVFGVIDEDRRGDVHRVHQAKPLLDPALAHQVLHRCVMFTKPRRFGTSNQRCSVRLFTAPLCHTAADLDNPGKCIDIYSAMRLTITARPSRRAAYIENGPTSVCTCGQRRAGTDTPYQHSGTTA